MPRSFAQHALDVAVSPDEVADAAEALGEAHQLIGDGSPTLARPRRRSMRSSKLERLIRCPRRTCARGLTETPVRWVGSLREPADMQVVWDYVERGLSLAGDGDSEDAGATAVGARLLGVGSHVAVRRAHAVARRT